MKSIHAWLLGASTLALAVHAQAQEVPTGTAVSEVIVTGSRIVRNGNDAPTPVTVASAEQLQTAAPKSITDALNQLPQFQSQQISRGGNQFSALVTGEHGNFVNLRNLGTVRTLVLMDGRRVPPTTHTGKVDVDVIPEMLVRRVEVVTGGASAVYGSDAVSGVVNYILDRDFVGVKAQAQYGVSQYNDGRSWKYGLAFGSKFADDRGHVLLSAQQSVQRPVLQADRPYIGRTSMFIPSNPNVAVAGAPGSVNNPYKIAFNVVDDARNYLGKFITGPAGVINQTITANGTLRLWDNGQPTGVGGIQIGGDGVPSSPFVYAIGGLRTTQTFGQVSYDITPNINASVSAIYARNVAFTNASGVTLTRFTFFSGNPFLPAQIQQTLTATNTPSVVFSKRIASSFPLLGQEHTKDLNVTAALTGNLTEKWTFEAYYTYGRVKTDNFSKGQYQNNRLYAALDAVVNPANGQVVCRTDLTLPGRFPGCVPFNPFDPNGESAAARAYVSEGQTEFWATNTTNDFNLSVSGELFDLWAGPVRIAVGGDYRTNRVVITSNGDPNVPVDFGVGVVRGLPATLPAKWSLVNQGALDGKVNVKELFGEVDLPLLRDLPLAKRLDVTGAFRHTDYSQSGKINSWKGGFSYEPVDDLRFRGTISRDIRAPVITEIAGSRRGVDVFVDPHTNTGTPQVPQIIRGNPDLKAEKGDTKTIGFVYQPRWLPRFSLAIDYFDIQITDAINTQNSVQEILDCELSNGTASVCDLIIRPFPFSNRTAANVPTQVTITPQNLSTLVDKGVDVEASYNFELDTIGDGLNGNVTIRALASFTRKYDTQFSASSPVLHLAGYTEGESPTSTQSAVPKVRGQLSAQYRNGGFGFYVGSRYIGKLKGGPVFHYTPDHIAAQVYFDTTVSYETKIRGADTEFFLTVNNLFNRKYPLWPQTQLPGITLPTITSQYDIMMRYFTLGARAKF